MVIVRFLSFLHYVQNLAEHFRLKIRPTKYDSAYHVKCPESSYDYLGEIYSRLSERAWEQIPHKTTTDNNTPLQKTCKCFYWKCPHTRKWKKDSNKNFQRPFYKRTVPSTQYSSFETFLLSRQIWTIKYLTTWLAFHIVLLTLRRWFFKNILFFVILINNTSNWSAGIYQFGFCAVTC